MGEVPAGRLPGGAFWAGSPAAGPFSRAMAKHAGPKLPLVVKMLSPMLNSIYDSQRLTTTAFFAEVSLPWRPAPLLRL